MTLCKCIKKQSSHSHWHSFFYFFLLKNTTVTINFHHKISTPKIFPNLLINNPHTSRHRQHPKKIQQHPKIPKIPNHPHAFISKVIHILLKKDTPDYPNH